MNPALGDRRRKSRNSEGDLLFERRAATPEMLVEALRAELQKKRDSRPAPLDEVQHVGVASES